jgi:hypothetical protein
MIFIDPSAAIKKLQKPMDFRGFREFGWQPRGLLPVFGIGIRRFESYGPSRYHDKILQNDIFSY